MPYSLVEMLARVNGTGFGNHASMEVVKRVNRTSNDRVTPGVLRTAPSVYLVNTPYGNGGKLRT